MGIETDIEWCDSSLQLQMGCNGCELWNPAQGERTCYAGQLVDRYGGPGKKGWPEYFDKPKLFPERLKVAAKWPDLRGKDRPGKPWLNGMPRMVFLDDMGDTFTEALPIDWLAEHLPVMAGLPFIFMLLTKRANRMLEFSKTHPFPKNFWLMTSVTSAANYNRVELLLQCRGGGSFGISYEPAWGPVDFSPFLSFEQCGGGHRTRSTRVSWVITGGSSGATAKPPNPEWFRDVRDQCQRAGAAYFLKQWGEWAPKSHGFTARREPWGTITPNGTFFSTATPFNGHDDDGSGEAIMIKVGKKRAGAILDGREWKQFPEVA